MAVVPPAVKLPFTDPLELPKLLPAPFRSSPPLVRFTISVPSSLKFT